MTYFKKFGDFCSGFAAFTALIYLFRRFMSYDFGEEPLGMLEKIKMFFDKMQNINYHLLLILALTFVVSVIAGRVLARLPYVTVLFCLPPLLVTVYMLRASLIEEYPMLYAIFGIIALVSAVVDCLFADRRDGKHRCAYAADAVSLAFVGFCLFVARRYRQLSLLTEDEVRLLGPFDTEILQCGAETGMKIFYVLAVAYVVLTVISLLLTDVYFIDAALALVPVVFLIYYWGADKIAVHPEVVVTFALAVLLARIIPTFAGKAKMKNADNDTDTKKTQR